MKNRRALSTLVGAVFFIIAASSTVAYVTYSMDVIDEFSQAVIIKESVEDARNSESFEIADAKINNGKFDLTVQNNGKIPLKITRLWVENTTDSTWNPTKFELNTVISPLGAVSNIGQNIELAALESQSYEISLVTERGTIQTSTFNAVSENPISINLHAAPEYVPQEFSTTLFMTVTNNLPTETTLLNIVPVLTGSGTAVPTCDSTPSPSSQPTLKSGESVVFRWSCELSGGEGDSVTFTSSIKNGFPGNDASVTVTIKDVLLALEAGTSLESLGFTVPSSTNDILTIHQETLNTPNGEYQLSSGLADTSGFTVDLDQNNIQYITNNKTSTITIPQGNWNSTLTYLSSHLDPGVDNSILTNGMIFHFENQKNPYPNSSTGTVCDDEISASVMSGGGFQWSNNEGIFSSGVYTFGGSDYISVNIDSSCNDLDNDSNSSAGWFYVDSDTDGRKVILRVEQDSSGSEFYEVVFDKSGDMGDLQFSFDSNGGKIVSCVTSGVTTEEWHHFVAVREDSRNCTLYLDGNSVATGENTSTPYNNHMDINGNWVIGANPDTQGTITEFFEGKIDSIMHWDNYALTSSEVLALNNTKYGNAAHNVDYVIEVINSTGTKTTLYSQTDIGLPFLDPLNDISNFHSSANITSSMNALSLTNERLLFTINFASGLGLDLRIDDESLDDNPSTSFVQLPMPSEKFPGYFEYDKNADGGNYDIQVLNSGDFGAFFPVTGIRGVFDDLNSNISYASIPQYVNGTTAEFSLTDTNDSVYLPPGEKFTVEFYAPTTHPSVNGQYGTPIPVGDDYNFYIYLSGYDELGRTIFKTIDVGGVNVK